MKEVKEYIYYDENEDGEIEVSHSTRNKPDEFEMELGYIVCTGDEDLIDAMLDKVFEKKI